MNKTKPIEQKPYYLGIDMGTNSIGWAVTDTDYKIIRKRRTPLWGVRMFTIGQTNLKKRRYRLTRRLNSRKKGRLQLLQTIFQPLVDKTDPMFFARMKESKFILEDKTKSGKQKNTLFNDENYDDKKYHQQYPTVYHLRSTLIKNKDEHDVRLVYLALHHIIKNRGHFLLEGAKLSSIGSIFNKLWATFWDEMFNTFELDFNTTDIVSFKQALCSPKKIKETKKEISAFFAEETKKEKQVKKTIIISLLSGGTGDLLKLFSIDTKESEKELKIKLSQLTPEKEEDIIPVIGTTNHETLKTIKNIYEWGITGRILGDEKYLSDAQINRYEIHKKQLAELKALLKTDTEIYKKVFLEERNENYLYYTKSPFRKYGQSISRDITKKKNKINEGKRENFYSFLRTSLDYLPKDKTKGISDEITNGTYLPLQRTADNSSIPYQVHQWELDAILENISKYKTFIDPETNENYFLIKDKNGLSAIDKIKRIFDFRVPYYIGPLSNKHKELGRSWIVHKEGKGREFIYPWNFKEIVDEEKSAEEFINRMTRNCTYFQNEKVLPKPSIVYSRYLVLSELNNIRIYNKPLSVVLKQEIYKELFEKETKVTKAKFLDYLIKKKVITKDTKEEVNLTDDFASSLRSEIVLKRILDIDLPKINEPIDENLDKIEEIIIACVTLPKTGDIIDKKIAKIMPTVTKEQIIAIKKLNLKEWGKLSKKLLTEIWSPLQSTKKNNEHNIIQALWLTDKNLMQLLSKEYEYKEKFLVEEDTNTFLDNKSIENLYVSPSVKKQIRQSIKIIDEIRNIMGIAPNKIFLEMAKGGGEKGKKTASRKAQLEQLYKNIIKEKKIKDKALKERTKEMQKILKDVSNDALKQKRRYLYFLQIGKCMYSGREINYQDNILINYDTDHIHPQSKRQDHSIQNNLVLVDKYINEELKKDNYPIISKIQKEQGVFWKFLRDNRLITREKYNRLTRTTELSTDELANFINRQLVEVRQGTKALANLLKKTMPQETKIVYVKASLVSDFRLLHGIIKTREINNYHHAYDAYLSIVVGNCYHTKFIKDFHTKTRSKRAKDTYTDEIKENIKNNKYSLKPKTFYGQRINTINGKTAWIPGEEGTIALIKNEIKKKNVLTTTLPFERKGEITAVNLKPKKEGLFPTKENDERLAKTEQYGGYGTIKSNYFCLIEYTTDKELIQSIEAVPVYFALQLHKNIKRTGKNTNKLLIEYFEEQFKTDGIKNLKILIPKIKIDALIKIDGFPFLLKGYNGKERRLSLNHAIELIVDPEREKIIKAVIRQAEKHKINEKNNKGETDKEIESIKYMKEIIDHEKLSILFDWFVDKLTNTRSPYSKMLGKLGHQIKEGKKYFIDLSFNEKCFTLAEILKLLKGNFGTSNLKYIGGTSRAGALTVDRNILIEPLEIDGKTNKKRKEVNLEIVHQSPTGFWSKV